MSTDDYRALCAELVEKIKYTWGDIPEDVLDLMDRADARLSQPEPEGVGEGPPAAPPAPEPGEVAELVAALKADAECVEVEHYDLCNMTAEQMRRAATLLQQLSALTTEDLKND